MTTTKTRPLPKGKLDKALKIVAQWMGEHGWGGSCGKCEHCTAGKDYLCGNPGPAPTGAYAARHGLGPELIADWNWPGDPTPTIILEGGPEDWAIRVADERSADFRKLGIFAEPYASYALCLYRP